MSAIRRALDFAEATGDKQLIDALRDLLVACEPYGRDDPDFCSAYHQARKVLERRLRLPKTSPN